MRHNCGWKRRLDVVERGCCLYGRGVEGDMVDIHHHTRWGFFRRKKKNGSPRDKKRRFMGEVPITKTRRCYLSCTRPSMRLYIYTQAKCWTKHQSPLLPDRNWSGQYSATGLFTTSKSPTNTTHYPSPTPRGITAALVMHYITWGVPPHASPCMPCRVACFSSRGLWRFPEICTMCILHDRSPFEIIILRFANLSPTGLPQ